jgi:hypothetical protein
LGVLNARNPINVVDTTALLTQRAARPSERNSLANHQPTAPLFFLFHSLTMLKRQRPLSPPPTQATYGDDLSSPILGPSALYPAANMSLPSVQVDPPFGISRKRPRISPDVTPGAAGIGASGSTARHTYFSSSVLSKRGRSPDPMDDEDYDDEDDESKSGPQISHTYSNYQGGGEPSGPTTSRPTIHHKRRRTTAPVLEGPSRGWGPDHQTGPDIPGDPTPSLSFDPAHPPAGWVFETQISEYAQENAKLHDLHTLRPRLLHSEEVSEDRNGTPSVDVDMEKVVKELYEGHNRCRTPCLRIRPQRADLFIRLLGSLFLERQRRLAGS